MLWRVLRLTRRLIWGLAVLGFTAQLALAQPIATGVRTGQNAGFTRFVLDLNLPVTWRIFPLADPDRLVIDLPEIEFRVPAVRPGSTRGLIAGLRFGQFRAGQSRIVLDLKQPATLMKAFLLPPKDGYGYRLVIDLVPVDRARFLADVRSSRALAARQNRPRPGTEAPVPVARPRHATRKIIVIDPGHGGVDPGTTGRAGTVEKAVTLGVGRALRDRLKATGRYRVVMTRDRDVFVSLRNRVRIGRRVGADLLISIHADAIRQHNVRGATVYTLSEAASDKEAAALAAKENRADAIAGVDLAEESDEVASILIDLAQRESMNRSAHFAQALLPELAQRTRLRTNSHRFAGFRVLKAPDVPSVLVELGYLSNAKDEALMRSAAGRRRLAEAIAEAIDSYFAAPLTSRP